MNLPNFKTERELMYRQNRLRLPRRRGWGRDAVEARASKYKLLYAEWISNKVLLQSTENYVQYPMINCHDGKEYIQKRKYTHI